MGPVGETMITYNNLYLELRRSFLQADCPAAGLEARELVCFGGGKTREEFYRDAPLYVPPETERAIRELARRHLDGEPVAYLIGEWEFYGLTLHVSEAVLIPRTDTEVLAGEALAYVSNLGPCRVLDLCAGSGCVGLAGYAGRISAAAASRAGRRSCAWTSSSRPPGPWGRSPAW